MKVTDRGLAAFLYMRNIPLVSWRKIDGGSGRGGRLEFDFEIGEQAFDEQKIQYFNSQLQKFDQAKISLMKIVDSGSYERKAASPA